MPDPTAAERIHTDGRAEDRRDVTPYDEDSLDDWYERRYER